MVLNLSAKDFDEVVSKGTVLVDFHAVWCGPCRMQGPIVEEIAEENENVIVGKVNVDDEGEIAQRFGIVSIPTLLVFKNGELVKKFVGLQNKQTLLDALK